MANQEASHKMADYQMNTNFEQFETKYVWTVNNCSKINLKKHLNHNPVKLTNNHGELEGHIVVNPRSSDYALYDVTINWNPSKFEEINTVTIMICLYDKSMNALQNRSQQVDNITESTNLRMFLIELHQFKHFFVDNVSFMITVIVTRATHKTIENITVQKTFMEDILKEFRSLACADVTIKVKDRIFRAHKVILMCRSEMFKNMLNTGMSEQQINQVVIDNMEPEDFEELLLFIYTDAISDEKKATVNLCIAAEKYNLLGLRNFCEKQLVNNIDCSNAECVYKIGVSFDNEVLRKEAVRFIVKNKPKFQNSVIESLCKHPEFLKFMIEFM